MPKDPLPTLGDDPLTGRGYDALEGVEEAIWTKRLRRGMGGAGWVGCADWGEVLIKVVTIDKPKMLSGLN